MLVLSLLLLLALQLLTSSLPGNVASEPVSCLRLAETLGEQYEDDSDC